MSANGCVRGGWDSDGPHNHTQAGVPGTFRSYDEGLTSHITGHGKSHKNAENLSVSILDMHSMVASGSWLVNGMPPILAGDTGCWSCPKEGEIFPCTIEGNPWNYYVEDKLAVAEGVASVVGSTMHDGWGMLDNGGSPDFFIGIDP